MKSDPKHLVERNLNLGDLDQIADNGRRAFESGRPEDFNPFESVWANKIMQHYAWMMGWYEGKHISETAALRRAS